MEEREAAEQRAAALIKAHHDKFTKRAIPPKEIPIGIPQLTTIGMITICRSQKDLDYIANVVRYWESGVEIKEIEPGYERDRLRVIRNTPMEPTL